ncbi:MAG TPA: xanthine dehydrogenase family protein molybdopterin-binding subunit [Polyangiales bacterium]|nr:xanthine dehydrogenase family protein molybdopterin-binding subunit [Polyangiales bacterium]
MRLIGQPIRRVDGPLKVRGDAKYAAEASQDGLLHGYVISSAITRGKIEKIDVSAAQLDGVRLILTHENRPHLPWFDKKYKDDDARAGSPFRPLYDGKVRFAAQPVALVVADTLELARHAASLVKIAYSAEEHEADLHAQREQGHAPKEPQAPPQSRGDADRALARSALRVHAEYAVPAEHHNPMECHASTVLYGEDGALTIYDKTQGPQNSQQYVCNVFGLKPEQVRVLAPFVGGAFGSGLRPQYQLNLAVMAARELKQSVRVALTRQQMFSFGHRPHTLQRVSLGARGDGKLTAVVHEALAETSRFEDYSENVVNWSGMLYQCDDVKLVYELADLDVFTPLDMRAPGATLGLFALESALDELAHLAGVDPVQLRLINYAERDQVKDKPFSSKALRECYAEGAARFGWSERNPSPRSMQRDGQLIGWGMATGVWEALSQATSARAVLALDGTLTISTSTTDIGTGTYTILAQIAAETAGVPLEKVRVELGDSSLPKAPLQGGSWTAASAGAAVQQVCQQLRAELDKGPPSKELHFEVTSEPDKERQGQYSSATHSAVFAEVAVDPQLGTLQVTRVVSAIAGGRILNPKTARSQIEGAVVWGIGMATHEHSRMDGALGRYVNHDFSEYHIPVQADVREIDVIFVDEQDDVVSPLGVKGLGEIGIVGVAAAIANAVFHATGKRIRELPITLDKLL